MHEPDAGLGVGHRLRTAVGILTSRDMVRAFAGVSTPAEARIREWMTAEPITVSASTREVRHRDGRAPVDHLPVVDGERPVGMFGYRQAAH